jgi:hypothetical protein
LVEGREKSINEASSPTRREELRVLGTDTRSEHAIDGFMITGPPCTHPRIGKVVIGHDGHQRLREVEVDMCVRAKQDVPKWWQLWAMGGHIKGYGPWRGRCTTGAVGVKGVEVELSEGNVPTLHPRGILEHSPFQGICDGVRGP